MREKQERQMRQQLKDTTSALESCLERDGRPDGNAGSFLERKARGERRPWREVFSRGKLICFEQTCPVNLADKIEIWREKRTSVYRSMGIVGLYGC